MANSIKTIKGRKYLYRQQSRRVNGKVKTTSQYVRALSAPVKIAVALSRGIPTPKEKAPAAKVELMIDGLVLANEHPSADDLFAHESGTRDIYHSATTSSEAEQSSHAEDSIEAEE